MMSCVGDDGFGWECVGNLAANGVAAELVRTVKHDTGRTMRGFFNEESRVEGDGRTNHIRKS